MPDPAHTLLAEPSGFGHAARAPVRSVAGFLLRRLPDHVLDFGGCDRGGSSRSRRVFVQRRQATVEKPVPPACCLLRHDSQFAAICLSCIPPAASNTILARSTLRAAALRARARDSSMSRCSVLSTTGRADRKS